MVSPHDRRDHPQSAAAVPRSVVVWAFLAAVVLAAAGVRWYELDRHGFELDEFWNAELTTGRGTIHETIEVNKIHIPPPATSLHGAPPWYTVPRAMDNITHPPLFSMVLRFWREMFGDGDVAARSFGAIGSALAIVPFFLTVNALSGRRAAVWAALLMCFAAASVAVGRQVRPYNLLMPLLCLAMWQAVRIRQKGEATWPAAVGLAVTCLACVFTHYFSVPVLAAACGFAAWKLDRRSIARCAVCVGLAAVVFGVLWGPTLLRQRKMMRESADIWMKDHAENPVAATVWRLTETPLRLILTPTGGSSHLMQLGIVLIPLAGALAMGRGRSDLRFWLLILAATLGFVAVLDVVNRTRMLDPYMVRYALPAAPAVIGLIAAMLSDRRGWLPHLLPAVALLGAVVSLPGAYARGPEEDHRPYAQFMHQHVGEKDIVVFIRQPDHAWRAGFLYATWSHYAPFPGRRVLILNGPATPELLKELRAAPSVWLVSWHVADGGLDLLAGVVPVRSINFLRVADVTQATFPHADASTRPTQ